MANVADAKLGNPTTRRDLEAGRYFTTVERRLSLGYVRPPGDAVGRWIVRKEIGRNKTGAPIRRLADLGLADDLAKADGKKILSYTQAFVKAASDPVTVSAGPMTVWDACENYLASTKAKRGERAEKSERGRLETHVHKKLGDKVIGKSTLTLTQLQQWRDNLVKRSADDPDMERRSKVTANRILATLKAALNLAYKDEAFGIESDKAWRALTAFAKVKTSRQDHFTEAEVLRLIDAARTQDENFANLIEATFHTGARPPGELAALNVRDFDAKRAEIHISGGKTGARDTTLSPEGVEFFQRMASGKGPRDILLPKAEGTRWDKGQQFKPMKRALEAAGLPETASMYTLRHTHISRAIENGYALTTLAKNVGTSVKMIEQNYAKSFAQTRRDQAERFAPRLRVIEGGKREAA